MFLRNAIFTVLLISLSGCGSLGFHDGGPTRPFDPDSVAEIEPRMEPLSPGGNPESYSIYGQEYQVMKSSAGFVQRGDASWYGTKFHGNKTSNGERYDMYAISAAHKRLPIPTYVEVTNLENGKRLIVRVNDRGPFHSGRIIDLSYAAAAKLGYANKGTAPVEIRTIDVAQYQREKLRTTSPQRSTRVTVTPLQKPAIPITVKATPLPMIEYREKAEKVAPTTRDPEIVIKDRAPPATERQVMANGQIYIQLGAFSSLANAEQIVKQTSQAQISKAGMATIKPVTRNSRVIYRVRLGPFSNETTATQILQHLIQKNVGEPQIFRES